MKRSRIIIFAILSLFAFTSVVNLTQPVQSAWAAEAKGAKKTETTTTPTSSPTLQSYSGETPLQDGTIVELKDSKTNKVAVATEPDQQHMYGVTVDKNTLAITISNSAVKNEVYVATSGTYNTLVSSQGGDIKAGDYVTLSAIDGVAMKADGEVKTVFGRAAGSFDSKSDSLGKVSLKDTTGKKSQEVTLGVVAISIDVKANPIKKSTKTLVPDFLQRIGEAVAEKTVSPIRMYLSIAITAISIVAAVVILYSGVRSSLISIGRNPLSKKSIFRGLLEIILTSVLILIIGLFAVYLLLKL